ncbi:MAG TPA: nucleotide exchange factor GrpE [Clostridiales bacterium]|nr:MAG: heat shock protein GrpE [Firmicutes bacterium ADurb.Bin262]HOU11056.1 nucleotide exchange factor GrpE [Clostridiales bacterium]HQH63886.1 nucleotide exchange factor GrpE [Clostridiales bacterium]HQK73237.1 nucleotide exchange factor GrpE [Clostridiales bacterium]
MSKKKTETDNTEPVRETPQPEPKEKHTPSHKHTEDKTAELEKKLAEQKDAFLRLAAEYDNYRKRSLREKEETYCNAKANILKELLPVIDNLERAQLKDGEQGAADYAKGVEMILAQFAQVLEKLGIECFGCEGDPFDPHCHEAVLHVEDSKLGENVVASVFSKGYKIGDKVIRSASVSVAN